MIAIARRPPHFLALLSVLLLALQPVSASAQEVVPPAPREPADDPAGVELEDINNWITILSNPNVGLAQREFIARNLVTDPRPEALRAVLRLPDDANAAHALVPLCRAIAQVRPQQTEFAEILLSLLGSDDRAVRGEAATALTGYVDDGVSDRLVVMVRDESAGLEQRSAAIEALEQLRDSKLAAKLLISLLDSLDGKIDEPLFRALARVSGVSKGSDPQAWRQWWDGMKNMTKVEWLQGEIKLLKEQLDARQARLARTNARLSLALEQAYLSADDPDRARLLQEYLIDEFEFVRHMGIELVQRDIGDGVLPGDDVLAVLRERLADDSPAVRRGVLSILGNLRNESDAQAVMDASTQDPDSTVRLAALLALGSLSNPAANGALMQVLQEDGHPPSHKVAAANSLGRLNGNGRAAGEELGPLIDVLTAEYARARDADLHRALLQTMASIADASFAPALLENLQHEDSDVRLRCIAGLRQIGNPAHLENLLPFISDPDVGVRREVAGAVGQLGTQESHLRTLLNRLGGDVEPEKNVRDEVWRSFVKVWSQQQPQSQLSWAAKLEDHPDRRIELLETLEERQTANGNTDPQLMLEVRFLLASSFDATARFSEAARYWTQVEEHCRRTGDARAPDAAVHFVASLLREPQYDRAVSQASLLLAEDAPQFSARLRQAILSVLEDYSATDRREEVLLVVQKIRAGLPDLLDDAFKSRLAAFEADSTTAAEGHNAQPPAAKAPVSGAAKSG